MLPEATEETSERSGGQVPGTEDSCSFILLTCCCSRTESQSYDMSGEAQDPGFYEKYLEY